MLTHLFVRVKNSLLERISTGHFAGVFGQFMCNNALEFVNYNMLERRKQKRKKQKKKLNKKNRNKRRLIFKKEQLYIYIYQDNKDFMKQRMGE